MTSHCIRYVKGCCHVSHPLQILTEKNIAFNLTDECEQAFNKLTGVEWVHCLFLFPLVLRKMQLSHAKLGLFFCVV